MNGKQSMKKWQEAGTVDALQPWDIAEMLNAVEEELAAKDAEIAYLKGLMKETLDELAKALKGNQ
jgi:uncharacterized membrane protein